MKPISILATVCIGVVLLSSGCRPKVQSCIAVYNWGGQPMKIEDSVSLGTGFCNLLAQDAILGYLWDLGDSTIATTSSVRHLYSAPGTYEVKLTVFGKWNSDTESKFISIVSATNQDYAGTYTVSGLCGYDSAAVIFNDTIPPATSGITASGTDGLVLHNFLDSGTDLNAIVDRHRLTIPPQVLNGDTFSGSGDFNALHNSISFQIDVNGPSTLTGCWLAYTKQ